MNITKGKKMDINILVIESYGPLLQHALKHALPQAAVWGLGSYAAHHLGDRKYRHKMSDDERKDSKRRGKIALATGASAGAIGSFL